MIFLSGPTINTVRTVAFVTGVRPSEVSPASAGRWSGYPNRLWALVEATLRREGLRIDEIVLAIDGALPGPADGGGGEREDGEDGEVLDAERFER